MTEEEATRLVEMLQRVRPELKARASHNAMTHTHEVEINGGDPRGVRLWLTSPRHVLQYLAWLLRRVRTNQD